MKKYLFSTLTAAAAMAVPAFSAELVASWDFSTYTTVDDVNTVVSTVEYADGKYLALTTGGTISDGVLDVASGNTHTSVDLTKDSTGADSELTISTDTGISIVMTVTTMSAGGTGAKIWSSISTDTNINAANIGEQGGGSGNLREATFAANGTDAGVTVTQDGYLDLTSYPVTITMTYIGDTLTIYEGDTLIAQATINNYDGMSGTINGVAIGSWYDGSNNNNEFSDFKISSLEIYKGDIMAVPEPSMFGLMFGLGAIGLVATRRRRRA